MGYGAFINTAPKVSLTNPYTYIDTLSFYDTNTWNDAVNMVSNFNSIHSGATAESRKQDAIQFLQTVASQWRANEQSFVQNEILKLIDIYRSEKDITKRDPELKKNIKNIMTMINDLKNGSGFDYAKFSIIINDIIKGIDTLKGRISNIKMNFTHRKSERPLLENIDTEFDMILSMFNEKKLEIDQKYKDTNKYDKMVAQYITQYALDHENELIEHLQDVKQFSAWLLKLSANFRVFLETKYAQEEELSERQYTTRMNNLEKNFKQFITEEQDMLLSFSEEDLKQLTTIADTFKYAQYSQSLKKNSYFKLPKWKKAKHQGQYQVIFKSDLAPSFLDERMGLLVKNAIQSLRQMGGSGMGDDSIGLMLNINYTSPDYKNLLESVEQTADEVISFMDTFAKLRDDRSKVLEANKTMNDNIEKSLLALDQKLANLEELRKVFIIHESDKYYKELEKGNLYFTKEGFHGRTMSILNYIDIMMNLSKTFGLGDQGPLMKFVAYNLGSHSPAGKDQYKISLEEIFTYTAGMIMFDDIGIAAKEAVKELTFSNVVNLHLYKLQELYFPASYLIEETAKYLANCQYTENNAVTASIEIGDNIYVPGYLQMYKDQINHSNKKDEKKQELINSMTTSINKIDSLSPEARWNSMRDYMASNTKVSIHFFLNFKSFIDTMYNYV